MNDVISESETNQLSDITEKNSKSQPETDKWLIAMFLKMTPEERLQSNDNAINAVRELKNAFEQRQFRNCKP